MSLNYVVLYNSSSTPTLGLLRVKLFDVSSQLLGFEVLIEKEWISFGFQFQKRLSHIQLVRRKDQSTSEQYCPYFLQFIECVWYAILFGSSKFPGKFGDSFQQPLNLMKSFC